MHPHESAPVWLAQRPQRPQASTANAGCSAQRPFSTDGWLSGSAPPLQAQAELDRLIQLEYWLKYDFTGCVRKLLPARQQVCSLGGSVR